MMKNKVILFNPLPKKITDKSMQRIHIYPPLSLLAISAPLDAANYKIEIIDAAIDSEYKNNLLNLIDQEAVCLGITSMTGYPILSGLEIAKLVRRKMPDLPIVWGGYHPSILPEQTAENEFVDVVVRGQGEATFLELVELFCKNKPIEHVLGITYKKNGKVVNNPDRQFEDINRFPPLPFHLVDVEKYITSSVGRRTIGYRTSQGCPFKCGFCVEPKVTRRRWSGYSAQRVLDDIEGFVRKYNIDAVELHDSNFFVDKSRVKEIFQGIRQRHLNIEFGALGGRADELLRYDDETWRVIKSGGCRDILIGAESGRDDLLELINKQWHSEDTLRIKQKLSQYEIRTGFSFIIGLPHNHTIKITCRDELFSILDLIKRANNIDNLNRASIMVFHPYPQTGLFDLAVKNGLIKKIPVTLTDWGSFDIKNRLVSRKYRSIIEQLNYYILPYLFNLFRVPKKGFRLFTHNLFRKAAQYRFHNKFFLLPFEYYLLILRRKLRIDAR